MCYTFKHQELISVFESWSTVLKLKLAGITSVSSSELWYKKCLWPSCASSMEGHPGCKTCQNCRKIAVTELLFLGRFEQTQLLPCSITQTGSGCWRVFFNMQGLLLFLWFTVTSFWKKYCYLILYLTSKLLLVVLSSAMFIFHQIMFVSNVCKS